MVSKSLGPELLRVPFLLYASIKRSAWRDCMKTPDRCRSGTPPSAESGLRGLYFGVWCYRRPTIGASPATFHTVSEGEFSEVRAAITTALPNGASLFALF